MGHRPKQGLGCLRDRQGSANALGMPVLQCQCQRRLYRVFFSIFPQPADRTIQSSLQICVGVLHHFILKTKNWLLFRVIKIYKKKVSVQEQYLLLLQILPKCWSRFQLIGLKSTQRHKCF